MAIDLLAQERLRITVATMAKRTDVQGDAHGNRFRRRGQASELFRGPNGQSWSGLGPCPCWLEQLIAAGRHPGEFLVPGATLPPTFKRLGTAVATFLCPKTGQTWTGQGYQPAWFRAYLKAGKRPADLLAPGAVLPERYRAEVKDSRLGKESEELPTKRTLPRRTKVVFVSPDGKETWSGHGRLPSWFAEHVIVKGRKASQLLAPDAVLPPRFVNFCADPASLPFRGTSPVRGAGAKRKKSPAYTPR